MNYIKLTFSLLLLISSAVTQAADLKQVFKDALTNDPIYKATIAANNAQIENESIALSLVLPTLSLSGNVAKNDTTTTIGAIKSPSDFESNGYSLSIKQTIYNHDYFTQLSQTDESTAIAKANFVLAKQELILRVASSYYSVLGASDNLEFAVAEKKSIQQQLHQTKQRFDVGLTAITDVHEAQSRFDQSVASEIGAKNLLAINKEKLREITGILYPVFKGLKENTPLLSPEPNDVKQWITTAINTNQSLFVAAKNMSISKLEISRAQSGHYPKLDFIASKNTSNSTTSFDGINYIDIERESTTLSVQLSIALYEGGRTSSRSQKAQYQYQQARELYEQQRRQTERETRTAYLTVLADISQVKALKQALASSKIALKATQAGFEVGTRTAVDVLNSQRELFRAQRNYAQARYEYILETLRLRLAAGTLLESDINNVNAWLVI
ncbi:Outer membrane channel TolC (OpmH) [hydrothermal vent metagenome]|uniref:Outer membrane channel TolC (OpmH) n=1 Tax=hydrothermal vent metagenome TaxID=652676 RepID=A0A3B1AEG8_9ZZZZ